MVRRILLSLAVIAFAGGVVVGGTGAFFSDEETSVGNVFAAGEIDLKIDNASYAIDHNIPGFKNPTGQFVRSEVTSWALVDLTIEKFFDFVDLKPGDYGEDTISVHVGSNDAWVCAAVRVTEDSDNTFTEPEDEEAGASNDNNDGTPDGDLDSEVNFAFWVDDGDNVLESNETESLFAQGSIDEIDGAGQIALADSQGGILGDNTPIPGGDTFYIGKGWCFGTLTPTPVAQDNGADEGRNPLTDGTGFTCDGGDATNIAQTDIVRGDIQFYAEQARNNAQFQCSQWQPDWPEEEQRTAVGADLALYDPPTGNDCDATVDDSFVSPTAPSFSTIQAAVDDVSTTNGETICVLDGTYNEDVTINKEIILAGDGASNTSIINGQAAGQGAAVRIAANNVTVSGFQINGAGVGAIRFSANVSGATVSFNQITSANGQTAVDTEGGQSNHTFSNNAFIGVSAGPLVYVNGLASVNNASNNVDFLNNTFSGSAGIALGQEASNSSVTQNVFSVVTTSYDVEDWGDSNAFNQNNFNDTGLNLVHSENGNTGDNGITNAENNWWGDADPSDGDVSPNADVDFTPFEVAAFPQN